MKKENIIRLVFNVSLPLLLSILVSLAIRNDFNYLETLNRNIVVPPIVFPIVWTILYVLMGIWAYFYEKDHEDDSTLIVYWISLLVNLLFSFLLFSFHLIVWAFIDVIVLMIMVVYLFIKTLINKKKYAYLLIPYILWLIVAFSLMLDLLINN